MQFAGPQIHDVAPQKIEVECLVVRAVGDLVTVTVARTDIDRAQQVAARFP